MITYDKLWKTMKEKGISQYKLHNDYKISAGQLDRLRKNSNVSTNTLDNLTGLVWKDFAEVADGFTLGTNKELTYNGVTVDLVD